MKNNILASLNNLKTKDIYSLLLFSIYKLKGVEEYSTLSELVYVLDKKNLLNFISVFSGLTITIPTMREFKTMIAALLMYQMTTFEGCDFEAAYESVKTPELFESEIKEMYFKLLEVLKDFDFVPREN